VGDGHGGLAQVAEEAGLVLVRLDDAADLSIRFREEKADEKTRHPNRFFLSLAAAGAK
jgi:hypothetical protein